MVFKKQQIVKFRHCDFAGIAFYPRLMEMWNELIEDWFREELKYSFNDMHQVGFGVPMAELNVKFISPVKLYDSFEKQLQVTRVGNSSVALHIKFFNYQTNKTVLEGTAVLVHVSKLKSCAWQSEIKIKMENFLS